VGFEHGENHPERGGHIADLVRGAGCLDRVEDRLVLARSGRPTGAGAAVAFAASIAAYMRSKSSGRKTT